MKPKVLTLGNPYRQDDGVGPWIARRLRQAGLEVCEVGDDLTRLLDGLAGADEAWVVEAVVSGQPPGTLHVLEVGSTPLPAAFNRLSSHVLSLSEALELARSLGVLPPRTLIYGIEGRRFGSSEGLSPEVRQAAEALIRSIQARQGHPGNAPVTDTGQRKG
jgi:hydrogenase maturation protease